MQNKTVYLFFFLFLLGNVLPAQNFGIVQETERMMSAGSKPGFRVEFINADVALVENLWTEFARKNFGGKLKKDRKSKELIATGMRSPIVGPDPFTLYTTVEKTNTSVVLTAFFERSGGNFLSRGIDAKSAQEVSNAMRQFYYDVRRALIGKDITAQEAKRKEMEARLKRLQKDNDNLRRDIEAYKAKIKRAEEDLVQNQKDQESTTVDIQNQAQLVEQMRQRLNNVQNEQ